MCLKFVIYLQRYYFYVIKTKRMKLKNVYFVSGIDTDAGKSYATGYLAKLWSEKGSRVITQKLIQTGCPVEAYSEDIELHRQIMGIEMLPEDIDHTTCPIRYTYPASPDLASRIDGVEVDLSLAKHSTEILASKYDVVLLEGAGGLLVPITGLYTMLDYVKENNLPVILVTNPRLGSVNHTLLSLEVCRMNGVKVDMLAYNYYGATSPEITADSRQVFENYLRQTMPECKIVDIPILK